MQQFIHYLQTKKWLQVSILCVILFATSYLWNISKKTAPDLVQISQRISSGIEKKQAALMQLYDNPSFLLQSISGQVPKDTLDKYQSEIYSIIILDDKDSIVFWSNNRVLPLRNDLKYYPNDRIQKYEIGESIYLKTVKAFSFFINDTTQHYNFISLLPIFKHYSITNNYLFDHFPIIDLDESNEIRLSKNTNDQVVPISTNDYIYITNKVDEKWQLTNGVIFLLSLIACILFILLLCEFSFQIMRRFSILLGFTFFATFFSVFRLATVFYEIPLQSQTLQLFGNKISNANTLWAYSLGDLIFDTLLIGVATIYFNRKLLTLSQEQILSIKDSFLNKILFHLLIIIGLFSLFLGVEDIITSSFISFNFNNFSYLNQTTLFTLSAVSVLFLCYFSISIKLHHFTAPSEAQSYQTQWILLLFVTLACLTGTFLFLETTIYELIILLFFALVQHYLLNRYHMEKNISLGWMGIFLIFYSALLTTSIEHAAEQKSISLRKTFVKQVALERDNDAEIYLQNMALNIQDDALLQVLFSNPFYPSPRKQAIELIKYRYLDNQFLGKYEYSVHLYTEKNKPFRDEPMEYDAIVSKFKQGFNIDQYITFTSYKDGAYGYLLTIPVRKKNRTIGKVILTLDPLEELDHTNIYVELLSRKKSIQKELFKDFTYALYKDDTRVKTNGLEFNKQLPYDLPIPANDSYAFLKDRKLNYEQCIIYKADNGYICLVSVPERDFFSILSVFAYIFCFGILLLILYQFSILFLKRVVGLPLRTLLFEQSLREKIQRGILVVTLSSFVAIALITIIYYSFEYTDYHRSRLDRKVESTAKTANWQIKNNAKDADFLPDANSLADIHKIDVNIFDVTGNLISSSEEVVFDRHLLGRKMDPIAYHTIRKEQQNKLIQNELINHFEYLSAYVPLKNSKEEIIGFLNLPYDMAGNSNIGSQNVVRFLGALLNVYVVFLIIAALAAFFIANSVSNPLNVIGEKLDKLRLGVKNEMIEWKNDDEIGELVQRYNSMIKELEKNALELARTQKETAWREMAKQVAHEIKNPLTPMKLNIQLLQRAVQSDPEGASTMVAKVSKALIEQIDALSTIASEFSNFAKMPVAKNEEVNLNQLVQNVTELFSGQDTHIQLSMCQEECTVFADKDQIIRVLNNVMKNAIQSIPDERDGSIQIQLIKESNMAKIAVKDNGIGIPENQFDEIFIPNFTTKSSGTGIGLAMSKNIVEMAKGTIYFDSKVDSGTTFYIELPIQEK